MEFLKYYPDALRIAKALTKDSELAEDIVQDIFLGIFKNKIEIDGEKNYKGYLNLSIRNRYFTHLGKKKLAKYKGVNIEIEKAFNVPDKETDLKLSDSLMLAIESTKSNLTLPLILHTLHDYTYDEIAGIMNIPIGTVRSRIFMAKEEIKNKMAA